MKNILITGASGFIGKNLVEYLSNKKQQYRVYAPLHEQLDLLDSKKVCDFIMESDIHIVVHGANVGGSRKSTTQNVLDKNLRMFFNLDRCEKYFEKLILLGSGAEYDKINMLPRVKEEDFGRFIPADDYGFSKYIMSKCIEHSEKMINLRMFGVFGRYEAYEYRFISNSIVKNLLRLPIVIRQNVFFDYVYINDCVRIIEWFIENKADHRFYNLSCGGAVALYTLAAKINEAAKFKSPVNIINEGLNTEYSADNSRLQIQIPGLAFTPLDVSIPELYEYYESIIGSVDTNKVIRDPYF